jgi:hypothetical protein
MDDKHDGSDLGRTDEPNFLMGSIITNGLGTLFLLTQGYGAEAIGPPTPPEIDDLVDPREATIVA